MSRNSERARDLTGIARLRSGAPARASVLLFALALVLAACSGTNPSGVPTSPAGSLTPTSGPPYETASSSPGESAMPSPTSAIPSMSLPPGSALRLTNLSEDDFTVRVYTLDADQHAAEQFGVPLAAEGVGSQNGIPPGVYRFAFVKGQAETPVATCDFELGPDDVYDFVIIDATTITIASRNDPPSVTADLLVESSPLCRAKGVSAP